MPVLPFHRYIGPGNPSENGPPVDEDDKIARQHDHNYDRARSDEEVRAADRQAIANFRRNWVRDKNWHSFIGDVGLSLKYLIESYTGVIYPDVDDMVIENDECRIIVVNNFLKLHCVFKKKHLIDKYKTNLFTSWDDRLKLPNTLKLFYVEEKEFTSMFPPFLYVPLNWSEIYTKSQRDYVFVQDFKETLGGKISFNTNVSKDSLKIITKYLEWLFFVNRKTTDKTDKKTSRPDTLELIISGYIFIDQDGNLH